MDHQGCGLSARRKTKLCSTIAAVLRGTKSMLARQPQDEVTTMGIFDESSGRRPAMATRLGEKDCRCSGNSHTPVGESGKE